jgi:1,5-anhydro-D-fructose reductase (1,5-anhydro-D-mannitol-forming)
VNRPLRWVLVGASDIAATRVIPAMRALGHEPLGVLSSDPARGGRYGQEHGIAHVAATLDEALSLDVDAVYVSTTNERHREQAIAALQAGRHVLCEKPIATTLADAKAIIEVADASDVVLATHHHLRASPVIRTVQQLARSGDLGSLLAIRVHHAVELPQRLRGWRLDQPDAGAGVVLDITVHDADAIRFITGAEFVSVTATGVNQGLAADGVHDAVMTVFTLDGDVLAFTHDAFTVPHAGTALEVHGSDASVFVTDAMTQDPDGEVVIKRDGSERAVPVGARTDLYVTGLAAFADAVDGTGSPLASGRDGYASLAAALAVTESIRTGRATAVAPAPAAKE